MAAVICTLALPGAAAVHADVTYYRASADTLAAPVTRVTVGDTARRIVQRPAKPPASPRARHDPVHPRLRMHVMGRADSVRDTVLVTLHDDVDIASPDLLQFRKGALRDTMLGLRRADYDTLVLRWAIRHSARVLERYWAIRALLLTLPIGRIDSLAAEEGVLRIEPVRGGAPPQPSSGPCGTSGTGVKQARAEIGSDAYVDAGYGVGSLALFDTGVRSTHHLLASSGRLKRFFDCSSGCDLTDGQSDLNDPGHGTATAALLIGGSEAGPDEMGMTRALLDSYIVYTPEDSLWLPGALSAFETALVMEYDGIVAEIAVTGGGEIGALSEAAGRAFDRDMLVVAANGNEGDSLTSPAAASRVLGVGAYCIHNQRFVREWVHGFTDDGRYKPDLTGPTSIFTAASRSHETGVHDDSAMAGFTGTSCATPVVAAAGLLLRRRLGAGLVTSVPPGAVHAMMLLATRASSTATLEGAGRVGLPGSGNLYWGEIDLVHEELVSLPVAPPAGEGKVRVDAAVWWPEPGVGENDEPTADTRADVDLMLLDDTGRMRVGSFAVDPVYERAGASGGPPGRDWTVQVYGARIQRETQIVYWAARTRLLTGPEE